MAQKSKKSIPQNLHDAQVAIDNSLADPVILSAVSEFGYNEEKLGAGRTLHGEVLQAVHQQKAAAGAQQIATAELKKAETEAFAAYQDLAKVARAVFADNPANLVTLGLDQKMPRSTGPFIVAGYKLFNNAADLTVLAGYGYNADRLTAETAKIAAYEQANLAQEAAKGAAQQATAAQRDALKALNAWVAQYRKIARVALRGNPQALEKLGIAARTSKTAAQRAAPAKAAATRAANKAAAEEEEPETELV